MKKVLSLVLVLLLCLAFLPCMASAASNWESLYREFVISNGIHYADLPDGIGKIASFVLHDIDGDDIPELIGLGSAMAPMGMSVYPVFAIQNGSVKYVDVIYSHGFSYAPDSVYPGLFISLARTGVYQTVYYTIRNGQVKSETVIVADADDPSIVHERTEDEELYRIGTTGNLQPLNLNTLDQIKSMGWDVFINNYLSYDAPTVNVKVNGAIVRWTDAEPFIDENNRTMVPLRAVAEALGLTVDWDGAKREAIFTNGIKTIYFPISSNQARTSDGRTVQMDTAAVIKNDRTFAPIRYLAEFFGYAVDWDGGTKTVLIHQNGVAVSWSDAYKEFLLMDNFLSAGQQYVTGSTDWGTDPVYSVALYDMDGDGIPELKISNGEVSRAGRCAYLYSFDGNKVVYLGNGPTDAFYNTDSRTGIYGYYRMSPDEINCTLYEKDGFSIKTTNKGQYSDITWPKNFVLLYGENIESIRSTGWDVFVSNAGF